MTIPDGKTIYDRYWRFLLELPELRRGVRLDRDEKLILVDYQMLVIGRIAANDCRRSTLTRRLHTQSQVYEPLG